MSLKRPLGAQMSHALKSRGVDTIFGIPGVHNVELYRGIEEAGITHVLARHEQGAGFMADGFARATGRPGVAYVITGPGVCNIMTPMGQAYSDSVPMLVISSCLERADRSMARGRLHEMKDQEAAAATVCDWSLTAPDADAAYYLIDRALSEFSSQRARSKHIQVPIDVLGELAAPAGPPPAVARPAQPAPEQVAAIAEMLSRARRPLIIVGGGACHAVTEIRDLLSRTAAASFATYAGRGIVAPDAPLDFGANLARPDSADIIHSADLVLVLGSEMSETDLWRDHLGHGAPLIRVDIDPLSLNDRQGNDIKVQADTAAFVTALLSALPDAAPSDWTLNEVADARIRFRAATEAERPGIAEIADAMMEALPPDTMIYSDMTQFAYVAKETVTMAAPGRWHHPFGFGTLGYALPAAIGGKIGRGAAPVLAIAGDYGFHYTMQELGVAVELGLSLPIIVWDNEKLQEIEASMVRSQIAPNSVVARNPDFCRLAEAFGAHAVAPATLGEMQTEITAAFARSGPTLIHVTPAVTPDVTPN